MKEKNSNKGVIVCLLFTIIVLVVIIVMLVTGAITVNLFNNNNETKPDIIDNNQNNIDNNDSVNNNSNSKVNSISDIAGSYKAEFNNLKTDNDSYSISVALNLYNNGIFTYIINQHVPTGILGNYVIDNNKIILTNWFNTGSDVSLWITKGSKELILNSDSSITDNNIKNKNLIDNKISSIKLTKTPDKLQDFDLKNRLGAAFFNEFMNKVAEPNL